MSITHTIVFKRNKIQTIQLPDEVTLPDSVNKVEIIAVGNTRIITPTSESWDQWFEGPGVSDDFMRNREQPSNQKPPL